MKILWRKRTFLRLSGKKKQKKRKNGDDSRIVNAVIAFRGSEGSEGVGCLGLCCYPWTVQQVAGDPHGNRDAAAATRNFARLIGFRTGRGN